MLVSKTVTCKITSTNRERLISLGYNVDGFEEIEVLVDDLTCHAGYSIEVQCDYCGNIVTKKYYKYLQARKKIPKDACCDCIHIKQKEIRANGFKRKKPENRNSNPLGRKIEDIKREFDERGYDLLSTEYLNNVSHLEYICRKHKDKGIQKIAYVKFHNGNRGCRFCGREKVSEIQKHSVDIVKNIIEKDYEEDGCKLISKTYTNYYEKDLVIMCRCGNHFTTSLSVFKNTKRSCPICKQSEGASKVELFLEDNNYIFTKEKTFKNLVSEAGNLLRFDFAVIKNKKVYCIIEYDGEFHYKKFYEDQDFEKQQRHDKIKNEYCISNNIPLIRIPYWEKDNISDILADIFICKNTESKFIINNQ